MGLSFGPRSFPAVLKRKEKKCFPAEQQRRRCANAKIRLRARILPHFFSSAATSAHSSFSLPRSRLFSVAAPASSNPSFVVEDYLLATCGLTRAQALKASTKFRHFQSPSQPDAVLAFLRGLGLPSADVAALVSKDPKFLCAGVEENLAPRVAELTGLGLSRPEIARLIPLARSSFRLPLQLSPRQRRVLAPVLGLLRQAPALHAVKKVNTMLGSDLHQVGLPNMAVLRECGLAARDIANLYLRQPRLLNTNPERVRVMAANAERVGVPRGSMMFKHALHAAMFLTEEKIAAKMDCLKKTFRWSDVEADIAVLKSPMLLRKTEDSLRRVSEFLISEIGLEKKHIAHRPALISYSLERRLRPRYYVLKFFKANGLLRREIQFYSVVTVSDKDFVDKFIYPHREAAPHLAQDFASACRGQVPVRLQESRIGCNNV